MSRVLTKTSWTQCKLVPFPGEKKRNSNMLKSRERAKKDATRKEKLLAAMFSRPINHAHSIVVCISKKGKLSRRVQKKKSGFKCDAIA